MTTISWAQALAWGLAAFFVVGFVINTFAFGQVGPEYRRWGYPDWFHFVTGALELVAALLLPAMATRLIGVALGSAIMLAAIATVVWHREYRHAAAPLGVLILLVILGATSI
jgi:sterol desaturase/sphingolipid hydroxylase (fatty acid hydroxylase superfamily)